MVIEFRCLNCRNEITANDADAGEKIECDQCGIRVTIPKPIGGELTNKRLRAPNKPPAPSVELPTIQEADSLIESTTDTLPEESNDESQEQNLKSGPKFDEQRYFDLENQPRNGFEFTAKFPEESVGKMEFDALVISAAQIRRRLLAHFEQEPQFFQRGALVLVIHHWRCNLSSHDVSMRLVGLLNDIEVSYNFFSHRNVSVSPMGVHFGILGILITRAVDNFLWTYRRESTLKRIHDQIVNKSVAQIIQVLDETAEKPTSIWTRFVRLMTRPIA